MAITKSVQFDGPNHSEIVTLTDSFGAQMVLNLPLILTVETSPGVFEVRENNVDDQIQQAIDLMSQREEAAMATAQDRGHIGP